MTARDHLYINWGARKALEDSVVATVPVAYWRLGEASGSVAADRFGGFSGTYIDTPTLGASGALSEDPATGVTFNGTSEYVEVPDNATLDVADAWSVFALVKRGATGADRMIISKGQDAFAVGLSSTGAVTVSRSNVQLISTSTTTLDTSWHAVFAAKTGSTVRIEIDGVDVTGAITNSTMIANALSLTIGADQNAATTKSAFFNGTLQDVALWNRYLTTTESAKLAASFLIQEFGGPYDDISAYVNGGYSRDVGRNAEGSSDKVGVLEVAGIDNSTRFLSRFRNLVPNGDFHAGIDGVNTTAVASVTAAATSAAWYNDPYTGAGTRNLRAVLTATSNSGVWIALDGTFRNGEPVQVSGALKSIAGNANVEIGLASSGTPANIASSGGTISGTYAVKTATLTPSADRSDLILFVRTTSAATATVHIARLQVNVGSEVFDFVFGPSDDMLRAGRPVRWVYEDATAVFWPRFHGIITRINESSETLLADLSAEDARSTHDVPIALTAPAGITHAEYRRRVLDAAVRVVSGSYHNMIINGSFESPLNTTGWTQMAGTIATTGAYAADGAQSLSIGAAGQAGYSHSSAPVTGQTFYEGQYYRATFTARSSSGTNTVAYFIGLGSQAHSASLTTTPTTHSAVWRCDATTTTAPLIFIMNFSGANAIYVDAVMLTQGLPVRTYLSPNSARGRQDNFAAASTWHHGWSNLEPNPEAVIDATSAWSTNNSGFITVSGGTLTRVVATLGPFATYFGLSVTTTGRGARDNDTQKTYRSGHTYRIKVYIQPVAGFAGSTFKFGVGSIGTPADKAEISVNAADATGWQEWTWTPSGTRTDAQFYVVNTVMSGAGTSVINFTGWFATSDTPSEYARVGFNNVDESDTITDIGGGVTRVLTYAVTSSGAMMETPAIASGGMTASATLTRVSGGTSVRFGLGNPYGLGSADDDDTTVTIGATPTRVSVTWNPTTSDDAFVNLYAVTASAAVVEFDIQDVVLQFGTESHPLIVPEAECVDDGETDSLYPGHTLENVNALSELSSMNEATLGVHWIEPTLQRPFWCYTSRARRSLSSKTIDHTIDDLTAIVELPDIEQSIDDFAQAVALQIDGAVIVEADTDPAADPNFRVIERDGSRWLDITSGTEAASLIYRRARVPRLKPTISISEANLSLLLDVEIDDLVSLDSRRARIGGLFLVVAMTEEVTQGGNERLLRMELEEFVT